MKTVLKLSSFFFALGIPSALAVEFVGGHLPAHIDALDMVAAFAASLIALIVHGDYAKHPTLRRSLMDPPPRRACPEKAAHPLAA